MSDGVVKQFSFHLRVRVVCNTQCAVEAQRRHGLDNEPVAAQLLGKALSGVTLVASLLKGEERVKAHLQGSGTLQDVVVEAWHTGQVRGYATLLDTDNDGAQRFLGPGILQVQQVLYDTFKPVMGTVAIQLGDVTSEFDEYLKMSDQIPSCISLETKLEGNQVVFSGGILAQTLPGAPADLIATVKDNIHRLPPLSELLQLHKIEEIPGLILPEEERRSLRHVGVWPVQFQCHHSNKNIAKLVHQALHNDSMLNSDTNVPSTESTAVVCRYCNEEIDMAQ